MPKAMANLPPKPRLPKEPDPKMLRTFGARPSLEDLTPPDPSAPPIPPVSPSAFRRDNPDDPPPAEYKPPSMLAEHRRLAILLAAVCVAFVWYCWKTPHSGSSPSAALSSPAPAASQTEASGRGAGTRAAKSDQPIYIDTVPEK
jgi:hypothetical protein